MARAGADDRGVAGRIGSGINHHVMRPTMGAIFVVFIVIAILPVAWLYSEFQSRIWLRILLGVLSLAASYGVFYIAAGFERWNYNAWYGEATHNLVTAEIEAIEAGRPDVVKIELKRFQSEFHATYETRANYDQLAEQTAERIRAAITEAAAQ